MSPYSFTMLYMFFNDEGVFTSHSDPDARWMVNFGIDCVTLDVFYRDDDMPDWMFFDCVSLSAPVSGLDQISAVVYGFVKEGVRDEC